MSMTRFRSDAYGLGISVATLKAVAPSGGVAGAPTATTTVAGTVKQSATQAAVAVADATDLPTAIALANANKAKINAILTALKNAGIMA